jgi:hypothetical protein
MPAAGEVGSPWSILFFLEMGRASSSPLPREEREWRREGTDGTGPETRGGDSRSFFFLGRKEINLSSLLDLPGTYRLNGAPANRCGGGVIQEPQSRGTRLSAMWSCGG